jgi:transcriptional regulator with XRE-family HTH domain
MTRVMPMAREAAVVLGAQVAAARRRRGETAASLADRAGISPVTLRKVERGDPSVALGTALDVACLVGVSLFGADTPARMGELAENATARLALLPARVTPVTDEGLDDDF